MTAPWEEAETYLNIMLNKNHICLLLLMDVMWEQFFFVFQTNQDIFLIF